ncbi:MAG: heavy-metal-associated domain-containing protein [Chitinophagaceae bacterium]|nr:heavy-metal-associated domain-containing protein [Chitinophagaceae bacterium]
MKKRLLFIVMLGIGLVVNAQFSKARLQASGLTCAMCSNAINRALQKLPFVSAVNADIKNSAFDISFKKDQEVEIEALRKAVEDAGFFIAGLQLTGIFRELKIASEDKLRMGKNELRFLEISKQTLDGEKTIRVLNKEYVTAKEFKKLDAATRARLLQSDKEANGKLIFVTI